LSLKRKRSRKTKQRKLRNEKSKFIEEELKKIPRYNVIDSKLNEVPLVPKFEKPFEMKDSP
jgi:hypothetical protein